MLRKLREGFRSLAPRMWRVSGVERFSGENLDILYAGPESQFSFLANRIFGPNPGQRRYLGRRTLSSIDRVLDKESCSFAVIAAPRIYLSMLRRSGDLCVPWWIDSRLDLATSLGPDKKASLKNDLRKVRRHGFSYRLVSDPKDYEFFYDRLYAPTIAAAHGDEALPSSRRQRMRELRTGKAELLFIMQRDRVVAGVTIDLRHDLPVLRDVGVIEGDRRLLKHGVITAANLFGFQHLLAQGYSSASFGLSRCFLDDGVLTYKRKWKTIFERPSDSCFLFRIGALTPASRSFFMHSPCISEGQHQLFRTRFVGAQDSTSSAIPDLAGVPALADYDVSGELLRRVA